MENDAWYDYFLENLLTKFPKKSQLVDELMDLLCIEREAVYRRLRKDVAFTVHEVVKIAKTWNISMDEIVNVDSNNTTFIMKPINYFDPSESDFQEIRRRIRLLEHLRTTHNSESMEVCNKLPRSILGGYNALYRFSIFRWAYQYGNRKERILFSQTVFPDEFAAEMAYYYQTIKYMETTSYIWDQMIFSYLIHDIRYFHSILLITDEEKEILKKELLLLLDYWSEVASRGSFPETKNKVNIYISKLNIEANFSYYYTEKLKMCRIHTFDKADISSFDTRMVEDFRNWMQLKKRTSVKISEVDERGRLEFFMKQQKLIEEM